HAVLGVEVEIEDAAGCPVLPDFRRRIAAKQLRGSEEAFDLFGVVADQARRFGSVGQAGFLARTPGCARRRSRSRISASLAPRQPGCQAERHESSAGSFQPGGGAAQLAADFSMPTPRAAERTGAAAAMTGDSLIISIVPTSTPPRSISSSP